MSGARSILPLSLLLWCAYASAARAPYNTSASRQHGRRNVHIVCHTHDDPGWLKTVDQYHYGSNNSIQVAGTQYILDSVMAALRDHPDRTFVYGEMAFFVRWWNEQDERMQRLVRRLVRDKQLGFVNGGYVQNDEAASHYVAMIDQTTRGHRFLRDTFNITPRVGWQIDPFGHSSTQAAFSALYGYDAQFFGRADYQDMKRRKKRKEMELLWRGVASFGTDADIFTGNFASGNYGPPPGFNWDWGQGDPQIQDDPRLHDVNVQERVDTFVKECDKLFDVTRGDDIMLTMGTDFTYANAHAWYKNLDKLIHYANADGRMNVFYSSPEAYVAAKHAMKAAWPLKTDDFFPYADCPHCYWTGYFSSRASAKGFIRKATSYLQAARQIEVRHGRKARGPNTDALEEAISLAQHHDAVTGTAKQHVADDYNMRINAGLTEAELVVAAALNRKWGLDGHAQLARQGRRLDDPLRVSSSSDGSSGGGGGGFSHCRLLNISVCEQTVLASRAGRGFHIGLYNPLATGGRHYIRIPVAGNGNWTVADSQGKPLAAQLVPISASTRRLQEAALKQGEYCNADAAGDAELVFAVHLDPLWAHVFSVKPIEGGAAHAAARSRVSSGTLPFQDLPPHGMGKYDGMNQVRLRKGRVAALLRRELNMQLNISMRWYNASDGADGSIASGAYIFRPNGSYAISDRNALKPEIVEGPVVREVRTMYSTWAQLTTRVWEKAEFVEVEWTVGPIPINDDLGKEVVVRYATDLKSGRRFATDASGLEMQERIRDWRPTWRLNNTDPVASNFYPVTSAIEIAGPDKSAFAVVTDRAQGGASLRCGEVELMLHRRLLYDDRRGVAEPLNETACGCRDCHCDGLIVRGTHQLVLDVADSDPAWQRREQQQAMTSPPVLLVLPHASKPAALPAAFRCWEGLYPQLNLLTLQNLGGDRVLLRLAHRFQAGESEWFSRKKTLNLARLVHGTTGCKAIQSIEEMTLSGATPLRGLKRLHWDAGAPLAAAADLREGPGAAGCEHISHGASGVRRGGAADPPGLEPTHGWGRRLQTSGEPDDERHSGGASGPAGHAWVLRPQVPGLAARKEGPFHCGADCGWNATITLYPMEIRTFVVQLIPGCPDDTLRIDGEEIVPHGNPGCIEF